MDIFDKMEIANFMILELTITNLKERKNEYRAERYQSNFCSHVVYGDLGICSEAIRPATFVEELERFNLIMDKRIKIAKFKLKYWQKFMDSLKPYERDYLVKRFVEGYTIDNERINQKAVDEIEQIQIAVSLWLGVQDEDTKEIVLNQDDYLGNMDAILKAMNF